MGEFHSNKIIPVSAFVVGQLVVGGSCKQSGLREPRDVCGKGGWPRQGAWGVRRAHTCLFSVRSLPGTFERLLCARCSQGLGQPQAHSSQSGVDRHGDHRDTAGNSEFVLENYFVLHLKKQMRASPVRAQFAGPWLRPRGQPAWRALGVGVRPSQLFTSFRCLWAFCPCGHAFVLFTYPLLSPHLYFFEHLQYFSLKVFV